MVSLRQAGGWPSRLRRLVALTVVLGAGALVAACDGSQEVAPPPQPSAAEPLGTLETSVGRLAIEEIEFADRFPPDCAETECFGIAPEDRKILVVWLARADGGDPSEVGGVYLLEASEGVVVTASDGSKAQRELGGLWQGRLVVTFTAPKGAEGFTLTWPGNEPIVLGP